MIYIASPYSHPEPEIRSKRFYIALYYAGALKKEGIVCFSPIVYGHHFALHNWTDTDHESWLDFNNKMMDMADEIHMLQINGWRESRGMQYEAAYAMENDIPLRWIDFSQPS